MTWIKTTLLALALLCLPLVTYGQTGPGGNSGPLFDPGSGSGDTTGPASSTDNAIARFDGTGGKTLQNTSAATIDDSGNVSANSYTTPDVDGENAVTLFGNPSADVDAPTGDDLSLFTDDTGGLFAKRPADGADEFTLASGAGRAVYIGAFSYAADPGVSTAATLADEREDDDVGCVSRSTNQIVISCAGTWRFTAAAWWTFDRTESTGNPDFNGAVYWYDDTNSAYVAGTSELNARGCGGAPITTEYVLDASTDTIPASFAIYPAACGNGTLAAHTGEEVETGNGRYVVERVR